MCRSEAENQAGPFDDAEIQARQFNAARDGVVISTISIDDLRTGTRSFTELIGGGEYGHVFRGVLTINGTEHSVAVKRLIRGEDRDAFYDREVEMHSSLNVHPHILNLLGCCVDYVDNNRYIVYEFMPLRSLHDWLHDRKAGEAALDWGTRMRIGAGVAKGLSYLNYEFEPPLIYTAYIKSSNVLLGVDYHPKISDFCSAVSVFGPEDDNHKADVFSFGVLLREIITGEPGIDWVTLTENFYRVADREMGGRYQMSECVKAMTLVNRCLQSHRGTRPDMRVVEVAMRYLAGEPDAVWPEVLDHQVAAEDA